MTRLKHHRLLVISVLVAVAALGVRTADAARGGPDAGDWMWADDQEPEVDRSWETPLSLTTITTGWGDEEIHAIDLSIPVTLYDVTTSRVWLSSNGWLSVVDPAGLTAPDNRGIPDAVRPNGLVAFHWDDLDGSGSSLAQHGPTPNGHLIVLRMNHKATGSLVQFHIQFYAAGGLKIVYDTQPRLGEATIGIENSTGSIGTELVRDLNQVPGLDLRTGSAILFYPRLAPDCASATPIGCNTNLTGTTLTGGNDIAGYGCVAGSWDGREAVHSFRLTGLTDVDLSLSGLGLRNADMFVLGASCDGFLSCIDGGATNLTLPLLAAGDYYVVVDGVTAADDGPYDLALACSPASEPIDCGVPYSGATAGPSGIDSWSCVPGDYSGPEVLLDFSITRTQTIRAELTSALPLDLFIVPQSDITRVTSRCTHFGDTVIQTNLGPGDYVLVVDGPAGSAGSFSIELTCDDLVVPLEPGMLVATCDTFAFGAPVPTPYVLGTIDVRDPECDPDARVGQNWFAPMYHNEMPNPTANSLHEWTDDNLGHVFGIAIDDKSPPNIYVTATSMFSTSGGSGRIWIIDGTTGEPQVFTTLANAVGPSGVEPGLGNIAFDQLRQQFYVTNHEDGKIYRLDVSGATVETFDPFGPDDGMPGFCPLGERLWGIGVLDNRIYFSVWAEDANRPNPTEANTIWSLGLDPRTGEFIPSDLLLEITIPPLDALDFSHPVSDIAFSKDGLMFVSERSMSGDHEPSAHQSRILEFEGGHQSWGPSSHSFSLGTIADGLNSAGGVDYDCNEPDACNIGPRVWATGDYLLGPPEYVYGIQGFPATGGTPSTSYLIDLDGDLSSTQAKSSIGDVEVYKVCDICASPLADATWSGGPCAGDTITLDASGSFCSLAVVDYRWLEGPNVVAGCDWSRAPTCDVQPTATTVYTLEVRCGGILDCVSSIDITVSLDPRPIPTLAAPTQICLGTEITLDASATDPNGCPGPLDYQFWEGTNLLQPWGPASTHGPLTPAMSTAYTVEARCGACLLGETIDVSVVPPPTAVLGPDIVTCADLPLTLDASGSTDPGCPGGLQFEWWRGATRVQARSANPTYDPPTSTPGTFDYTVVVSCDGLPGCETSDVVQVRVNACVLEVDFDSWQAVRLDDGEVAIRWTTLEERGTLGFEVRRSTDPSGTFVAIEGLAARGGGSSYVVVDRTPANGLKPWYRIVEVTASGPGDATPPFTSTPTNDRRAGGGRSRNATRHLR